MSRHCGKAKLNTNGNAENFMISVKVSNANVFWKEVNDKKLPENSGIRLGNPVNQPYGREVNLIDMAGVCWHFVE